MTVQLPPGFVLDQDQQHEPTLPPGFVLDNPAPHVGQLETFGRAAVDSASFGLSRALMDNDRLEAGRKENPWTAFAGDVAGAAGGIAATGGAAGIVGNATRAGRVLEAAHAAMTPAREAETFGQLVTQGAKAGASYGAAHGVGSAIGEGDITKAPERAVEEGLGGAVGGGVLAPVAHGVGRVVARAANRMLPGANVAADMANDPTGQGARDIVRNMTYDGRPAADLVNDLHVQAPQGMPDAVARGIADDIFVRGHDPQVVAQTRGVPLDHVHDIANQEQALRAQYGGQNLLEAMRSNPPAQGQRLPPDVPIIPPQGVHPDAANVVAERLARGESAPQVASRMRMQGVTRAHVDEIAQQADALQSVERRLQADNVVGREAADIVPETRTTTNANRLAQWAANQDGPGADAAALAFETRKNNMGLHVADAVEGHFDAAHQQARSRGQEAQLQAAAEEYNRAVDAAPPFDVQDFGGMESVPLFRQALNTAAIGDFRPGQPLRFWRPNGEDGESELSARQLVRINNYLAAATRSADGPQRFEANQVKQWFNGYTDNLFREHPDLRAQWSHLMRVGEAEDAGRALPLNTGGRVHESLAQFQAMQQRSRGSASDRARAELAYNAAVQRHAAGTRGTPPPRTALNAAEAEEGRANQILDAFRRAWGEKIADEVYKAGPNAPTTVLKSLLTPEGKARILTVLGRDDGRQLISFLYNQQLQSKLGNTLYGGPDTAWKMARDSRMGSMMHAGASLIGGRFSEAGSHLWNAVSQNLQQQRADAVNHIFASQGVDALRELSQRLAGIQAQQRRLDPYFRNPAFQSVVPGIGPAYKQLQESFHGT